MFSYIKGKITFKSPTYIWIDVNGLGYEVNVSLITFEHIKDLQECRLFIKQVGKIENQNLTGFILYGFFEQSEKELFEKLTSVSGVGSNTAITMLSTYKVSDIINAIVSGDVAFVKSIKGIGPKSAQRIILELKDKVVATTQFAEEKGVSYSNIKEEALMALVSLGFNKNIGIKAINKAMVNNPDTSTVESLIKDSLKLMR
ncbi:MAG: Holliday junction branch migration protein RuvA [Chitinophagales bacterium]